MNRILITLVILLILSISPVNAVQIKETRAQEHYLEQESLNTSQKILKHLNKGAFIPILFIYIFKLIKILQKTIKKIKNKIEETKEEIERKTKETIKEINQQIDEIDTNTLIEVLGENHPVTQKVIYLKETKITNPLEFVKYSYTLLTFQKSLKKVIKDRETLKTPEELEKTKKIVKQRLHIHYIYTYLLHKAIIYAFYTLIVSTFAILIGGILLFIPRFSMGSGLKIISIGILGASIGTGVLIPGLGIYTRIQPEKTERKMEKRIQEIEEEIEKQRPHSNNTDIEESIQKEAKLKKLKELKNTKKMLEKRLEDHDEIVQITEILPPFFISCFFMSLIFIFLLPLLALNPALEGTLLLAGLALKTYSITFLAASATIYFISDPEKREETIEERIQEINQQIKELEHKIKETPNISSKMENNTTIVLKNNTTITSIGG